MAFRHTALGLLLLAGLAPLASGGDAEGVTDRLVVEQRPVSKASPVARLVVMQPGKAPRLLAGHFHGAAEADVSFDGTRIVFAGQRTTGDPWCIWETSIDGVELRQVTCGPGEARQPLYLPRMYTLTATSTEPWDQIAFVGVVPGERPEGGDEPHTALFACRTDGSRLRRLTFNVSNDRDPTVLPDGRILFSADRRRAAPTAALFAVNIDGTDLMVFSGNEGHPVKRAPAWVGDKDVVFVEGDDVGGDGSGTLAAVSLRRNLHSYRALTGPGDGIYRSPSRRGDGSVLAAWRPDGVSGTWGIRRFDPGTGRAEGVLDDAGWHEVEAQPLTPRPVPDGRSSSVRGDEAIGWLYGLDVGISDLLAPDWTRELPRRLRVLEGVPLRRRQGSPGPGDAPRRLLGEVDLAGDGSFHVQVPADTPIELQLLDEDGVALRSCRWIWTRWREARGCIGCHEDPERTPPNRLVEAVRAPAVRFDVPPGDRRAVDFREDVRPIVQDRCLGCHGPGGEPPILDGDPSEVHRTLLDGSVHSGRARTSPLAWHLVGRVTSRPWDDVLATPPPSRGPDLTDEERRTLLRWIDLGALLDGTALAPVESRGTGGGRR